MLAKTLTPVVPMTVAIRAKTPKGENSMMMATTFSMTSEADSKRAAMGLAFSPVARIAEPRRRAKKMVGSSAPSARALKILAGTTSLIPSPTDPLAFNTCGVAAEKSAPSPGWARAPRDRPTPTATEVVNR